jgi:hypothetical protein
MNKIFFKSLAELAVVTYLTAFLGLVTADAFDVTSILAWKAAAVSAIPAVLAVVYGAVARFRGNFASALAVDTRTSVTSVD